MAKPHRMIPALSEQREKRIWGKVDKTPGQGPTGECWAWTGYRNKRGYGMIRVKHQRFVATRFIWHLTHGEQLDSLIIRHKCDWPPCCNPDHLEPGTNKDNAQDASTRGRKPFGEKSPHAKFNDQVAQAIIDRFFSETVTYAELAKEHSVARPSITRLITGKVRKHLKRPDVTKEELQARIDEASKNCARKGENIHLSKLKESDVREIRRLYGSGVSRTQCALKFGVTLGAVCHIISRKTWKHID